MTIKLYLDENSPMPIGESSVALHYGVGRLWVENDSNAVLSLKVKVTPKGLVEARVFPEVLGPHGKACVYLKWLTDKPDFDAMLEFEGIEKYLPPETQKKVEGG